MNNPASTRARRLLLLPARRPVATLAVAAVVLALACWSIGRLRFNPRLEALLPGDTASAEALDRIGTDFHLLDEAIVLVESNDVGDEADEQERRAAALLGFAQRFESRLLADARAAQLIDAVEHSANPQARRFVEDIVVPHAALYLDDGAFDAMLARLAPAAMRDQVRRNEAMIAAGSPGADQLAKQVLRDPLRLHELIAPALTAMRQGLRTWRGGEAFISPDARALLIRVSATGPATDMDFTRRLMALLRETAAAASPGALVVDFGGAYAIAQFSEREIRSNMIGTVTGSIVLMQLLYLVAYRRIASFALIFLPVACGMAVGLGVYGVFFGDISPVSAGIGAILAGLGDDFSIHYMSHYEGCRRRGLSVEQSTDITGGLGPSLLHACATSIIGFLAIAISPVPALRDFALLGALGLAGALLGTVTVLPASLAVLERFRGSRDRVPARFGPALLERLTRPKRAWVIGAALLLLAAGVAAAGWNSSPWLSGDLHAMHPQPNPPLQTQQRIGRHFGMAPDVMLIHLTAPSPEELSTLAALVQQRVGQPALRDMGVESITGPATFLPEPAGAATRLARLRAMDRQAVLAAFDAAIGDSLFNPDSFKAYRAFLDTLLNPPGIPGLTALAGYPSLARLMLPAAAVGGTPRSATQALAAVRLSRSPRTQFERDRVIDALRRGLVDVPGARLTGLSILGRDMELAVRRDLPRMALIAGGFVLLWIVVLFRRPGRIALALIPSLGAALFMLAALRWTGTGLDMVNMAAIPILFGIAIDDGIFLVAAFDESGDTSGHVMAQRCHAVTLSTLTTILGFGSLMWASVPAMASLGLALAAGMTGCWIASLFVVVPLLARASPATGVDGPSRQGQG
jgi:predicted RND superfamily exporter protein